MKVWREAAEVERSATGRAVTIGAFDGVHLGHVAVVRLVHELARARGLCATVLTFDRHPAEVVRPQSAPCLLTNLDQKLELLDATGLIDECLVLRFDETRSKESAEEFVEGVLSGVLKARLVVVGADFHFGNRRHGDVPLLQRMGAELGFEVLGLGLVAAPDGEAPTADARPYSSTRVRELLAAGEVEAAAEILGRPYELRGLLDKKRFDTHDRACLPTVGRYAGELTIEGASLDPNNSGVATHQSVTVFVDDGIEIDGAKGSGPAALRFRKRRN